MVIIHFLFSIVLFLSTLQGETEKETQVTEDLSAQLKIFKENDNSSIVVLRPRLSSILSIAIAFILDVSMVFKKIQTPATTRTINITTVNRKILSIFITLVHKKKMKFYFCYI